jgi:outer membrane protein insertion porin family
MKNSRARLLNPRYFSYVDVSLVNTQVPERKDSRIDVKEANTGKACLGRRIRTGWEIVGFLGFSQRNFDIDSQNKRFQGGEQKFRSCLQIGKYLMSIDVNFEEPWWHDRELAIETKLFSHQIPMIRV